MEKRLKLKENVKNKLIISLLLVLTIFGAMVYADSIDRANSWYEVENDM